ncbi:MAG: DUF2314 domain-containing protein [Caulobacter sp.]|nr:DUF2314 domain-containing protein [Caulobacter sp.]
MRRLLAALTASLLLTSTAAVAQDARNGPPRALASQSPRAGQRPADDPVTMIPDSDREMKAAVAEAVRTLPMFWSLYASDEQVRTSGKLKVGFPFGDDGREHMWLRDIRREDDRITGVLENIPEAPMAIRKGDRVPIDPAEISDWSYSRDGRLFGNFTTRAMLKYLEPALVRQLRQLLSDRPLEGSEV